MLKVSSHKKAIQNFSSILKIKVVPMAFYFCKTHIPQRKMKLHGMMILIVRCIIPTLKLIHVVFLLLFLVAQHTVRKKASDKPGQILIIEALIDDIEFILICITLMSRMVNYLFRTDKPVRKFRSYLK